MTLSTEQALRYAHRRPNAFANVSPQTECEIFVPRLVREHRDAVGMVEVPVIVRRADINRVIAFARHAAFMLLAERGVSDEHVSVKARRVDGNGEIGEPLSPTMATYGGDESLTIQRLQFKMSDMLTAAVDWDEHGRGTLPAIWQV